MRVGLAASSFTSVSIDPPLVSFSVANTSQDVADPAPCRSPGRDHAGRPPRRGVPPARGRRRAAVRRAGAQTEDGALTLDDGLARFDCTVYREVEAGDHLIVILRLHAVEHADDAQPLVFHRSAFGSIELRSCATGREASR